MMSSLQIVILLLLLVCHGAVARLPLFRIEAALHKDNNDGSRGSVRRFDALVEEDAKSYVHKYTHF